jgi:cell division protein FtsB
MEIIWVFWSLFGMVCGVVACLVSDNHIRKEQKKIDALKKEKKKLKKEIKKLKEEKDHGRTNKEVL